MSTIQSDLLNQQLQRAFRQSPVCFAGTISPDAQPLASVPRFAGSYAEKPQTSFINRLVARVMTLLPRLLTQLRKLLGQLGLFQVKITQADKTMEELLAQPLPTKVDYPAFKRPSTGVRKARHTLTPQHPLLQRYGKGEYLHILESTALSWSQTKITRDALQNFYDGQGQTLDDTRIEVSSERGGKYRVKVSASATYDPDKLLGVGATGKRDSAADAETNTGGFGAGAKDVALCLLRDHGVEKVIHRSGEWQLEYYLQKPGDEHVLDGDRGLRGLHAKLTLLDKPIQGNEFEFVTTEGSLADKFRHGRGLFYHAGNPDFQNPTYENELGGFKLIGEDEEAHFYHAGQRREVSGFNRGWRAMDGIHIWTNKKLLSEESRDRLGFQEYQVLDCLEQIIGKMSAKEAGQAIELMKKDWFVQDAGTGLLDMFNRVGAGSRVTENRQKLLTLLCQRLGSLTRKGTKDMPFQLPPGLFTVGGMADPQALEDLKERGYIPVSAALQHLGVISMGQLVQQLNVDNVGVAIVSQTAQDKARIDLLKKQVIRKFYDLLALPVYRASEFEQAINYDWSINDGKKSEYNDPVLYADPVNHVMNVKSAWLREADFIKALTELVFNSDLFGYREDEKKMIARWLLDHPSEVAAWGKLWQDAGNRVSTSA